MIGKSFSKSVLLGCGKFQLLSRISYISISQSHPELKLKRLHLRIPPPIVAIICGLIIWKLSEVLPVHAVDAETRHGIAYTLFGMAGTIDIWALLSFRKQKTTIDPRYPHKTSSIVTCGIYSYSRNPMYLGLVLILSATGIYFATFFGFFVIIVFILYINTFQINPEEDALEKQFGEEYLSYKDRVRRWI
jgi:protein-S-isoprenylcysteine O-methyltransferase Ste14